MEASNASPMAVAVSVICCIWVIRPSKLLWMVCRVPCMVVAVAMIGPNWATIGGNRVFIWPIPATIWSIPPTIWSMPAIMAPTSVCRAAMLSLNVATPSMASKAERMPSHAVMLSQCCSQ